MRKAYKFFCNNLEDDLSGCTSLTEKKDLLNDYYNSLLIYKMPEVEEDLTIEKLNEIIKRTEEKENANDENSSVSYHREEEDNDKKGEKKKKIIIFDGSIDDTWTEYINNIYDKENYITLSNGYKLNFRDEIKLFFETTNDNKYENVHAYSSKCITAFGVLLHSLSSPVL